MNTLDSRVLQYIDCFAQMFSTPGQAYYRLTLVAGRCLPIDREGAFRIDIKDRQGGQEGRQHNVLVKQEGSQLIAEPRDLEIETGDTVLWATTDPKIQGFAVQGESPDGRFDSSSITFNAVYTHAFGTPGDYKWVDANGGKVSGTVSVHNLDGNDPEQCKKWIDALSEGTLIMIRDDYVEPDRVEIITGQTVLWAIERASGISITDSRLVKPED